MHPYIKGIKQVKKVTALDSAVKEALQLVERDCFSKLEIHPHYEKGVWEISLFKGREKKEIWVILDPDSNLYKRAAAAASEAAYCGGW